MSLTATATRKKQGSAFDVYDLLFFGAVLAVLFADFLKLPTPTPAVLKGLPLAILLIVTAAPLRRNVEWFRLWVSLGLAASLAGDIIIMSNFLGGIAAFFVAHVMYVVAMGLPRGRLAIQSLGLLPALAFGIGMHGLLAPRVPADLYIPVVGYMGVIMLMFARACSRVFAAPRESAYWLFFIGAVLFVLSDSLIAISRWVTAVPYDRFAILGTYFVAQWFIVKSVQNR
jgi:uncharacterized membrane protein YhhN